MSSDSAPESTAGPKPISPATRRRLQQCFEHATRNSTKGDYDYANNLFTQCVVGDPGNLIYLQNFLGNLQKKYNNNKKGGKLAGLKGAGTKALIKKCLAKKDWHGVIKSGCDMLALNPWDTSTLTAMAKACEELDHEEGQLFCLRTALDAHPKDPEVNRLAGLALERMGQFDQAIACWRRVELAKPGDEEAQRMIGNLTINKTIQQGHYEEKVAGYETSNESSTSAKPKKAADTGPKLTPEQQIKGAIARDPAEISNYLKLADLYEHAGRLDDAESTLNTALDASGGGDLGIRERIEDLQMVRGRHQVEVAEKRAAAEKTAEAIGLLKRVKSDVNQTELTIYAARCERTPGNPALEHELGLRLKRTGKYNEAIQHLQAARSDVKRKAAVLVELGECFHHIKQYKLAMTNYLQAVEASSERDLETKKLALYRAGKLATGLRDLDTAETHLTALAELDFGYKDVGGLLDKLNRLRDKESENEEEAEEEEA
ncbi:MAG: tetratricopeptide repeat protein [Pirellulales bacterium]